MIPGKITVKPYRHDKKNVFTITNNHLRNNFATGLFKPRCFKQQHTAHLHQCNKNLGTLCRISFIRGLSCFKIALLPNSVSTGK